MKISLYCVVLMVVGKRGAGEGVLDAMSRSGYDKLYVLYIRVRCSYWITINLVR